MKRTPLKSRTPLKRGKPLRRGTKRLKTSSHAVPLQVKKDSIKLHGDRCYAGECGQCHGLPITVYDDPDHQPPKGPHSTPDLPEFIYMARRECHTYYTDHPAERKELFSRIAAKGFIVHFKNPYKKGIGKIGNSCEDSTNKL